MNVLHVISSVFVWIAVSGVTGKSKTPSSSALSDILDDLDSRSDNRVRPGYGEGALEVQAFAFIRNIIEISEEKSTMTVNLLLMQMWNDPRLSFEGGGDGKGSVSEILVDNPDFMSTFWNPDTFIVNEVTTDSIYSSGGGEKNLANQIMRLSRTGDVLKTSRITVSVSCPMRFENFPMHAFTCDIDMESCKDSLIIFLVGHKTDDIVFIWRNGSRSVDLSRIDKVTLSGKSGYFLQNVETHSQQSYLDTGGSYSKLIIRFHFRKLWLRHAITFFFPTAFLTVCSLLSLWIIQRSKHALIGVIGNFIIAGLLILLMGLEYSTTPILSRVPFLTPVDYHLGICLSTVFSSICFHGVHFLCRNSRCYDEGGGKKSKRKNRQPESSEQPATPTRLTKRSYLNTPKSTHGVLKHSKLDDEVTYYESYDVTEGEEDFDEGKARLGDVGSSGEDDQRGNKDLTAEGASGRGRSGKSRSRKIAVVTCLINTCLISSKWLSLSCFLITEFLLWFTYVIGWSNGGGAAFLS